MDSLGIIWKLIYLEYEKSLCSVAFDLPVLKKYPYLLTYLNYCPAP